MALDTVPISPPFVVDDKTTITGVQPNYAYLFEDRIELYVLPNEVPTITVAYDGTPYVNGGTVIKLSALDTATLQAAITLIKNRVESRLENYPGP